MTEDEQFIELERSLARRESHKESELMNKAVHAAYKFIDDLNNHDLGIYTIRKAFELGYRTGYGDATKLTKE
jgi:hypothetical protein